MWFDGIGLIVLIYDLIVITISFIFLFYNEFIDEIHTERG